MSRRSGHDDDHRHRQREGSQGASRHDGRDHRTISHGVGPGRGVAAPAGRTLSDAGDVAKAVLDIIRKRALIEQDPLHKMVILRSFHMLSCPGPGCDSGDELDLKIAQLSQGTAERIKLKRKKKRPRMGRLPAPVPAVVENLIFQNTGEVEVITENAVALSNGPQSGSASNVSQSDDVVQPPAPADSIIENREPPMEEIYAALDATREYKLFEYEADRFARRHERGRLFLRALRPYPELDQPKPIRQYAFIGGVSDPRPDIYSSPERDARH